ncbi:TetR-like C-terminal domain-containing protein [Kitasatospora sp. NPDC097691]|uniref:TetR-like C-terminal domain-containing protein n=1 Tax=Kitasatospora sp. NPDC097691 TaxID=3157231 RepID=UPI003327CCD7
MQQLEGDAVGGDLPGTLDHRVPTEDGAADGVVARQDLTRPGGIAFFRAEVSPDVDERRSGLRECLQRATAGLDTVLEASRGRGETPPPPGRLLDRIVAPLYFRVVFSVPDTDEAYARALVADLFGDPRPPQR